MRIDEIARQYNLDKDEFQRFIEKYSRKNDDIDYRYSFSGWMFLEPPYIEKAVNLYLADSLINQVGSEQYDNIVKSGINIEEISRGELKAVIDEATRAGVNIDDIATIVNQREQNGASLEQVKESIQHLITEKKESDKELERTISRVLITSGFNFDGYKVVKYSGYISGDDCITMPRNNFFDTNRVDKNLCDALVRIRRNALKELKEAASDLGCNAVIGVDFDYLVLDPQHAGALNASITVYEPYVICVTANGNAVVIEKE